MAATFNVGDQVLTQPDKLHDNKPHKAIVKSVSKTQGIHTYSLHFPDGYGGKSAWYEDIDLELIYRPDYK